MGITLFTTATLISLVKSRPYYFYVNGDGAMYIAMENYGLQDVMYKNDGTGTKSWSEVRSMTFDFAQHEDKSKGSQRITYQGM